MGAITPTDPPMAPSRIRRLVESQIA
jgi:hypothetical protein